MSHIAAEIPVWAQIWVIPFPIILDSTAKSLTAISFHLLSVGLFLTL
jgi:hypothetical protein